MSTAEPRHGMAQPLLFTLAALLVYRLGCLTPLYGLDPKAIAGVMRSGSFGIERLSVFALGVVPLFSVMLLVELGRLLLPISQWEAASPENPARLRRWARGAALVLALIQAVGIANALDQVPRLVLEPGLLFRATTVATLVGATALLIWLGDEITRRGIGSGFWLLLSAPLLAGLPGAVGTAAALTRSGQMSLSGWLAAATFVAAGTAALVALDRARSPMLPDGRLAVLWPPILASSATGWLFALVTALVDRRADDGSGLWGGAWQPAYLAGLAVLVVVFSILQARGATAGPDVDRHGAMRLAAAVGGVLAVICVAGELLKSVFPITVNGVWLIIFVTIALRIRADMAIGP